VDLGAVIVRLRLKFQWSDFFAGVNESLVHSPGIRIKDYCGARMMLATNWAANLSQAGRIG
jgi:hypothetical protein